MSTDPFDPLQTQMTSSGILVVRDKGFINRIKDIASAEGKKNRTGLTAFDVHATHQGWNALRLMILKEVPDDTRIPFADDLAIAPPGTTTKEDIEHRIKIAQLQPVVVVFRRHRPAFREKRKDQPEDFAMEIGLVSDFEFPFESFDHIHGQNRSIIIHDYRQDNDLDEDGIEIPKSGRKRERFGRLHDIVKVLAVSLPAASVKTITQSGPGIPPPATGSLSIPVLIAAKMSPYLASINWSKRTAPQGSIDSNRNQINPKGLKEPGKIWHPGGFVYESQEGKFSNIDTVFLFDPGNDDFDGRNRDGEPDTILDHRHDAHYERDDPNAAFVPKHQDGRIYFTSMPPAKDLVGYSPGATKEYIGYMVVDKDVKNADPMVNNQGGTQIYSEVVKQSVPLGKGTILKHETGEWRPQVKIPTDTGSKTNTYIHGSSHGTSGAPVVNTTSPRREVYGPTGDTTKSHQIPNLNPGPNDIALRFRIEASLTTAIGADAIKLVLAVQKISDGGSINPAAVVMTKTLTSADVPAGTGLKFNIDFDVTGLSAGMMLNMDFARTGDDLGDTYSGDLEILEESWYWI